MRIGHLGPCLLILTLASGVLFGQQLESWKYSPVRGTLENGLTYIFQKDDSSELTCLLLLVRGGKSAEPAGKNGLAYLSTRLAIEVSDEGKVRDLMVRATRLSVASMEDCTIISVQCLSVDFEESLKIVSEIIQDPLFSGLRIDAIVENMGHQGNSELDSASNAGHAELMRAFFGPDGYGGAGWGTEASLKSIRKDDITRFYKTYFVASNMVFSVASNLEGPVVSGYLKKYFGGLETGPRTQIPPSAAEFPTNRRIFREKDAKQSYLGMGFLLPDLTPRNYALAYLAEDILGGGVGSRLWALRFKESLAYSINSAISYPFGKGLLEAYLETSPEKLGASRSSLERVFRDLAAGELTGEDLEISKTCAAVSFLRMNETKEARARTAALFEARGLGCEFIGKLFVEIRNVDLDEMNLYLKEILSPERAVEVVIGPVE